MKKYLLILIGIAFFTYQKAEAQNGNAEQTLNKVAEQMSAYQSMQIKFKYTLDNKEAEINQSSYGDVTIKGDQYKMNFMGNIFISDGNKTYVVMNSDEEVNVVDNKEDESLLTPKKMLFFFQEGFRYQWIGNTFKKGKKANTVKLLPIDSESEIKHVIVDIDSNTNKLMNVAYTDINNTTTSYEILKFQHNQTVAPQLFNFDVKAYEAKGFYINE